MVNLTGKCAIAFQLGSPKNKECSGRSRTSTGSTLMAILANISKEDKCVGCEDMPLESGILKSSVDHFNYGATKKKELCPLHNNTRRHIALNICTVFTDKN